LRRERRNREDEILDAAVDIFWRKGYAAASVQDVAETVGLLKGSLYHYIDSKEELLFRIFEESHRQAQPIVDTVAALELPPLARLHRYVELYVVWYFNNVERAALYFTERRYLGGEKKKAVYAQGRVHTNFVQELITEAKAEGDVRDEVDPKFATFFVMGALNGVPDWYRRTGDKPESEIARLYADMVVALVSKVPS
jgi:TetR/AcrR family transcriptional regulator, cholesterol catabolism regulator